MNMKKSKLNRVFLPYKNVYEGKEGILLGTGPTLNQYDFEEDDGTRIKVGVNSIALDDIKLDYYFCGHIDKRSKSYIAKMQEYQPRFEKFGFVLLDGRINEKWLTLKMATNLGLCPYELTTKNEFRLELDQYPVVNCCIAFSGLQFMVYAGIKKIYLVGCDTTQVVSYKDSSIDSERVVSMMMDTWKLFSLFAAKHDVEIVSINPVGLKGMFKDVFRV